MCSIWGWSCADSGLDPSSELHRIRVLDGDNQTGLVGSPLPLPLRVEVSEIGSGVPAGGVPVDWSLSGVSGAALSAAVSTTDAAGVAATTVTLGSEVGEVRVMARTRGSASSAGFSASAAASPTLEAVGGTLVAGSTARLRGSGFVPDSSAYLVTFSGIQGAVEGVGPNEVRVRVPSCLPTRAVSVRVAVDGRPSNVVQADVSESISPLRLAVGEDLLLTGAETLRCRRLGFLPAEEYLLSVQSAATATTGVYPYVLVALGPVGDPQLTEAQPTGRAPSAGAPTLRPPTASNPVHDTLRSWERDGVAALGGSGTPSGGLRRTPARAPVRLSRPYVVGDTAHFRVLDGAGGLEDAFGVLRAVTAQAEIFVDVTAPEPGFTDEDLVEFGTEFDEVIYPTVERAYGAPSDLDGSGRIAILFTPAVNRLSPRTSGTLVAGYFFAGDLSPQDGSPPAERFYAAVPDPNAVHSDALDRALLLQALPAVLTHEFQHMVHYNQRILLGGAERVEALWLQEALAQMAEDLVATAFDERDEPSRAAAYREGNLDRAQRYLSETRHASLTVTSGSGTLAERGGGWLFIRYITDHLGGESALGRMTRSARLGTETIVAATGEPWSRTFSDFGVAVYLGGLGAGLPARFGFVGLDLRSALAAVNAGYPLEPERLDGSTLGRAGTLRSATAEYYVLTSDVAGEVALTFVGEDGRATTPESAIRLRLVRYR